MTAHDWLRAAEHFPIGAIAAWLTVHSPALGLGLLGASFAYEIMNDWRKGDTSYKDVLGIVQGFGVVAVLATLWS